MIQVGVMVKVNLLSALEIPLFLYFLLVSGEFFVIIPLDIFFSIVDFFKELPQFIIKSGPILSNQYGADWEKRIQVIICLLYTSPSPRDCS